MSTHTPGPWSEDEGFVYAGEIVGGPNANCLYEPGHRIVGSSTTLAERKANAKLIAAAPDLLEALMWATGFLEANYSENDIPELAMLRAALAKAGA